MSKKEERDVHGRKNNDGTGSRHMQAAGNEKGGTDDGDRNKTVRGEAVRGNGKRLESYEKLTKYGQRRATILIFGVLLHSG